MVPALKELLIVECRGQTRRDCYAVYNMTQRGTVEGCIAGPGNFRNVTPEVKVEDREGLW